MFKKMKQAMQRGLGRVSFTRAKATDFAQDLRKRGIISADEAEKVVDEIVQTVNSHAKTSQEELRKALHASASAVAKRTKPKRARKTTKKVKKSSSKTAKKTAKKASKKSVKKSSKKRSRR